MGKIKMKKMQVTLEKTTASMVYPILTKVNDDKNGEHNIDAAKRAYNKIPEEEINQKFIDYFRGLADEIDQLTTSEDLRLHINEKVHGGLHIPNDDTPKDFFRKIFFSK